MNKKKKKTNLEELYARMLKEYDKDHPGAAIKCLSGPKLVQTSYSMSRKYLQKWR